MKELKKKRQIVHQTETKKLETDFDELFHVAKEIQDALKKEYNAKQYGLNPEDYEHFLDDYLSDNDDDDEKNDDENYIMEEKKDFTLRVR